MRITDDTGNSKDKKQEISGIAFHIFRKRLTTTVAFQMVVQTEYLS